MKCDVKDHYIKQQKINNSHLNLKRRTIHFSLDTRLLALFLSTSNECFPFLALHLLGECLAGGC